MPSLRTALRYITLLLLIIAIILLLAAVILWFLAETGYVDLQGLEPLSVFTGFVVSALLWLLGRLAERRLDRRPPQSIAEREQTIEGDDNVAVQGDGNITAINGSVAAGGDIGSVTVNVDEGDRAADAERNYLQGLANYCNALPLGALGGSESNVEEATLADVFIKLDTTTLEEEEGESKVGAVIARLLQRQQDPQRETEKQPIPVLEAATHTPRMVLLGDPGSGKSSFVRYLVGSLARARLGEEAPPAGWKTLLPLFVVLRDLAPALEALPLAGLSDRRRTAALVDAVQSQWQADIASHGGAGLRLTDHLRNGTVLLVFDGLDEVPLHTRRLVRLAVQAVLSRWQAIERIIVTCRIRSYEGDARFADFDDFTLAPLDRPKIDAFVAAWYNVQDRLNRLAPKPTVTERIEKLQRATHRTDLRTMAQNPMLLTTMTLVHQQETELPGQRVVLYSKAVNVLLRRWQVHKGYQPNPELDAILRDDYRIRPILEAIAWEAHRRQSDRRNPTDLRRGALYELLERPGNLESGALADAFLDYIDTRSGLIIGLGGDDEAQSKPAIYTFPHRTFQEYLAGCHLTRKRNVAREIHKHAHEGDVWYLAVQYGVEELLYAESGRGKYEFLNLAYALCPPHEPTQAADLRSIVWSGHMAATIGTAAIERDARDPDCTDRDYLERLRRRLQAAMVHTGLTPVERAEAGRHLARIGDPRDAVLTVAALPLCYVPPGPFTMGNDDMGMGDDEKPRHTVNLPYGYWIGQFPVTNAQFEQFVAADGYANRDYWREAAQAGWWQNGAVRSWQDGQMRSRPYDYGEPFTLANHPVVGVTWYEMLAFTRWLTDYWRQQGLLPQGWSVQLPSEAEWEKAARGGQRIPQTDRLRIGTAAMLQADPQPSISLSDNPHAARRYTWAVDAKHDVIDPAQCNYDDAQINASNAVGVFPQTGNPYGCQELLGNVFEWTRSLNQPYGTNGYQPDDGRENLAAGGNMSRVLRGGVFAGDESWSRCGIRDWLNPYGRGHSSGFRIAVSPIDL